MPNHKVDLEKLSSSQLEQLLTDASAAIQERKAAGRADSLKKLKESGELQALKTAKKNILGKIKELGKAKFTFEVTVPIVFTLESELEDSDLRYYSGFYHTMKGALSKNNNLTARQAKLLKGVVEEYAENACEDILQLAPDDVLSRFDDLEKEIAALQKQATKAKLDIEEDL